MNNKSDQNGAQTQLGSLVGGAAGLRDLGTRIITQQRYEECREYWRRSPGIHRHYVAAGMPDIGRIRCRRRSQTMNNLISEML